MNGEIEGSTRGPRGPKNCRLGILGHPKTEDDFQILFYTKITYYTQNVNDFYDTSMSRYFSDQSGDSDIKNNFYWILTVTCDYDFCTDTWERQTITFTL